MRKYFYFMIVFILSGGMFTSCLDNEEPKGIESLRGALSELYKAHAQVQLAEAEVKKAEIAKVAAEVEWQNIQNKKEEVKVDIEKATLEAMKISNERLQLENQIRENEAELKKLRDEAWLDHEKLEWALQLERQQVELDSALSNLEKIKKMNELEIEEKKMEMELAVEQHKKKMLVLQKAIAEAEFAYQQALKLIEAQKTQLSAEQQRMLDPIVERLSEIRDGIQGKQEVLITAERELLDAKFDFDPVSYGKKLSLEVTRKEAALALAKEMKDKVSVFKDKPFAEWEKELVICEDSVKQLIAQSDGIDMQIEKINLNEQQPIRDDQTRLERERAKIQAEINALEAEQRNILSKRYEGGKAFSLVLPNHDMDKILYRNILYANNWEYYISNYNADDHVFVGDMVRFDQNVSLSLMRMILLGDGSSEGLIKKLSDMVIADGTLADITSKRDLWNTEKEGFEAEHRDKLEELTKTDGIYEKFEKAWTAYWTTSQPLLNFQQVWDDFAGLTDPSETQRKVMFASVKDYLNKRTALDGDGNISEASITTTVDGITTTVQKKVYLVTEAEYLANQSSVENAIRNSRYYLSEIGLDYADGGAYKAYLDASRILFGTSSGKDNARSEDLSVDDFNGKLELNDDGTLKSSWELNQVLNNLKLNSSDFQQSVWFKKFQAATMYELLDSKITGRVTWQAILASARELLGDDTKPESVNGQIDAIKKEAAALDPKIETLGETIVAINKQYNDKAAEITKITADKITPLQFQKRILQSRKEAFEEMWRSILTIMGTNADGTVTPGWSESAGDIKEKLDVQIAQREDKIIEAEKALAIAQMKLAAFEEGLISGDDGAEELQRKEIADLEKKIAELKAEITQLQKEFEEETARKDHLMEIFLGNNK